MDKDMVLVHYGSEWKKMTKDICEKADLASMIGNDNKRIGLKPNLVNTTTADQGATTHPEIAAGVIEYLQEKGYSNIVILEGSWVGEQTKRAVKVCGFDKLCKTYGVEWIDTQTDTFQEHDCQGLPIKICDSALQVDFMINLPVMKGHCQTTITCALKNNKGVIPNSEKRYFHTIGLHKPIAHLNTVAKNDFIIVDGICGDLDFEEGGNPVSMNCIMGFADPVLCDAYVCSMLGYSTDEVPYITMAEHLGVGSSNVADAKVVYLQEGVQTCGEVKFTRRVEHIAKKVNANQACSACYGSLIHAMDRLEKNGILVEESISIGQGFKGKTGKVGIGSCTSQFQRFLPGCPPKAIDMIEFLNNE